MNEVSNLKYINSLLEEEKQTRRIQDAQELLKFVIWKLEEGFDENCDEIISSEVSYDGEVE